MKGSVAASAMMVLCALSISVGIAWADLSPGSAFLLISRTAPGSVYADVVAYLGEPTTVSDGAPAVSRWGQDDDDWVLDVEHRDGEVVSTRVTWRKRTPRDARSFFAAMTREGRETYGRPATYPSPDRAVWDDRTSALEIVLQVAAASEPRVSLTAQRMSSGPAR